MGDTGQGSQKATDEKYDLEDLIKEEWGAENVEVFDLDITYKENKTWMQTYEN